MTVKLRRWLRKAQPDKGSRVVLAPWPPVRGSPCKSRCVVQCTDVKIPIAIRSFQQQRGSELQADGHVLRRRQAQFSFSCLMVRLKRQQAYHIVALASLSRRPNAVPLHSSTGSSVHTRDGDRHQSFDLHPNSSTP
jgi:hypothetical protein